MSYTGRFVRVLPMYAEAGKCEKCGGIMVVDDIPTVGFPQVEVIRCIKCGNRVYKGYPKRDGAEYAICGMCGKTFKRRKKTYKHENLCPACGKEEGLKHCIVCGAPIVKGIVCTKRKCHQSKSRVEELQV